MIAYGLDPGSTQSAFIGWDGHAYSSGHFLANDTLLDLLRTSPLAGVTLGIEQVRGMGMYAGNELFDTCIWTGRFMEAAQHSGATVLLVPRKTVITAIVGIAAAGDKELKAALRAKYGAALDGLRGKEASHLWSALGVAEWVRGRK